MSSGRTSEEPGAPRTAIRILIHAKSKRVVKKDEGSVIVIGAAGSGAAHNSRISAVSTSNVE